MLLNTFTTVTTTFTTFTSVIARVLGANDGRMGMHPRHLISREAAAIKAATKARKPWQASQDAEDQPDDSGAYASYGSACRRERRAAAPSVARKLPVVVPVLRQIDQLVALLPGSLGSVASSSGRASASAS